MTLKNVAAITGCAELRPSKTADGMTAITVAADLARQAALDAGLAPQEVDGLLVTATVAEHQMFWPSIVGEALGLRLRHLDVVDLGGASCAGMVWRAAAAIEAGLCGHVLCMGLEVMKEPTFPVGAIMPAPDFEYESPYGASAPNAGYAMIARRHMHEFGTTSEQLASIAVSQRANALLNPDAMFNQGPLSIDDVLNSKLIFDPLHLLEIVSPCSGGAAVIVSKAALATGRVNPPVWLLGAGEAGAHTSITSRRDITTSWAKDSAATAFAMAGLAPNRMDFAQIYDCYTIAVLTFLEDLGFCAKGHGGAFVSERNMSFAGDFPCNTNGGQLSFGQAGAGGGMNHVVEAARQLMGKCGARQVNNATLGVAHGNGGVMSEEVTLVLGT